MRHAIYAALVLLACFNSTWAEVRIKASPGGDVFDFLKLFTVLRHSGDRIVIDGPCLSACTLVLSKIPRKRICVTRHAILGFHAPMLVDRYGDEFHARPLTRAMAGMYPAAIRTWIRRHGGLSGRPIFLYGRALTRLYPLCR